MSNLNSELTKEPNDLGLKCPECGQTEEFAIDAVSTFYVTTEGADQNGDVEWGEKDRCQCNDMDCMHVGTVADFTVEED